MSIIDRSSKFSFSQHTPIGSPCGLYIAYINGSNLLIRYAPTLECTRSVQLSKRFVKITQIQWEPIYEGRSTKIALLISSESKVKILDVEDEKVNIDIMEDEIIGIEKFQWLNSGERAKETAYQRSKQIIIFNRNDVSAKLYSLDYQVPLYEFSKPRYNKLILRSKSHKYAVVTESDKTEILLNNLINYGSTSRLLYKTNLGHYMNLEDVIISPNSQWVLCNDKGQNQIHLRIFPIIQSHSNPIFEYKDTYDPLGALQADFLQIGSEDQNDYDVLFSDHFEQINQLRLSANLNQIASYRHTSNLLDSTIIFRQNLENTKYIKKLNPFKIPQLANLPIHFRGILKFLVKDRFLFSVANSMPGTVFIWDLASDDDRGPLYVIVTNSKIKDIQLHNEYLLILNERSISFWKENSLPISINPNSQILTARMIQIGEKACKLLVSDINKSFFLLELEITANNKRTVSQFQDMDTEQIDLIRRGSPQLTNDLTKVKELARIVQQNEWGLSDSMLINEDTFQRKKKPKTS
ncbi:hypothetical protein WICMUC_002831 [Wickerhamomyces mucosus]|uniref:Uncharacterized protein n=1 Tax=Wickerhamomyces mucosus TaxID=1378264 RepID=A0A9P8PP99_9ASCO|nr:hypothetical protein WICMUC_002831 [Wickerhamomyces mucosus]